MIAIEKLTMHRHYGHNEIIITTPLSEVEGKTNAELLPILCEQLGIDIMCLSIKERGISRRSGKGFLFLFDDKMN
jgi:hypothetical protein